MATLAGAPGQPHLSIENRERRFFLILSLALAAAVLLGFGAYIALGISSFAAPWWVHVHAVSYMIWIALYVNQNRLVVAGQVDAHRRMGGVMAGYSLWMVFVGFALLYMNTATHRTPPIFTPSFLMAMNTLTIAAFVTLLGAGLLMRGRSDWHRRLMLGSTICVIAPALGRITVVSTGFSLPGIVLLQLGFVAGAAVGDLRIRGMVHPAYGWVAGAIVATGLLTGPFSGTAPILAAARAIAPG